MERQTISEVELIRLAQNGNPDAFGDLYQSHLDAIYRYVYARIGESAEAENLTQATFLKAWRALGDYRPSQAPFRAWLYRIAHNTVVDHCRSCRGPDCSLETIELPDASPVPEESCLAQERQEMLRNAIGRLKPDYQEVLALRFLSGLDYPETAQALGRNVNAVRVLQFRALAALRTVLAEDGSWP